jgi:hypothetical protein
MLSAENSKKAKAQFGEKFNLKAFNANGAAGMQAT